MLLHETFGIEASTYPAYYDSIPRGVMSGDRQTWIALSTNEEGFFIHLVSANPLSWQMISVLHNGQYFDSITELKKQYRAGTVNKVVYKPMPNCASLEPKQKPSGPKQIYVQAV